MDPYDMESVAAEIERGRFKRRQESRQPLQLALIGTMPAMQLGRKTLVMTAEECLAHAWALWDLARESELAQREVPDA